MGFIQQRAHLWGSYGGLRGGGLMVLQGQDLLYSQCCSHQDEGSYWEGKTSFLSSAGPKGTAGPWEEHLAIAVRSHWGFISQGFTEDFLQKTQGAQGPGKGIILPQVGYFQGRSCLSCHLEL